MRKRIYINMLILAMGVLIITSAIVSVMFFQMNQIQTEGQMGNEAEDIAAALMHMNKEETCHYVKALSMKNCVRITIVGLDGVVQYDTEKDASMLENHKERPEIKGAIEQGKFFNVRFSTTTGERTYNYAIKLRTGSILRISYVYTDVYTLIKKIIPSLVIIFLVVIVFTLLMAWKMSNKIIEPINGIDIHQPQTDFIYKEFNPLLKRISKYNDVRTKNEKLRREFSANVSHELKTPITSISGYAELIQNGMVKPEDVPVFAGKIVKESGRLIHLVDDIIKLSRLDERKNEIDKVNVDFQDLSHRVWESLQPVANQYKVSFFLDVDAVRYIAVELMMEELIYNLCENALKYNKPGGFVKLSIHKEDENVVIEVEDNGIGVPKDCQGRIFERFYRVDKSHSKQIGGTGLGLAIVKHVVEYHEGEINIESQENVGTKIIVVLK